jgi:hypothetical protein
MRDAFPSVLMRQPKAPATRAMASAALTTPKRRRRRASARGSVVKISCARSPASVNVPTETSSASAPGAASASASRNEREVSSRDEAAVSAMLAATAMPSPRLPSAPFFPESCSAPWFRPADSGRPAAAAVSARWASRSAAAGEPQRRRRVGDEDDRGAVGRLEHDPASRGDFRGHHGDHRLELRAHARLLARRAAAEILDLEEHHARHDGRVHQPKSAAFPRVEKGIWTG